MPQPTPWTPPTPETPTAEAAQAWWLRLASREATAGEVKALRAWLAVDAGHRAAFERARAVWRALDPLAATFEAAEARDDVPQRRRAPARAAAALGAGLTAMVAAFLLAPALGDLGADYRTAPGEVRRVSLPDGSLAWLDTSTALTLDRSGGRGVRLLHGQAWFQVRHDAAHPFQVVTPEGTVTDLGTRFGVRLEAGRLRVSVAQGAVRLSHEGRSADLSAGQAALGAPNGAFARSPYDPDAAAAWTGGRLVFAGRPLGEVVGELNRYGGDRIWLLDQAAARRPVSAILRLDNRAAGVDALALTQGLGLTRLPGLVLLTPKA